MRQRAAVLWLSAAVVLSGCAGGDDEAPENASPIVDAVADVPGIEIGNDTGSKPDTSAPDSGSVDSGSPADTGVAIDSTTADTFVADTFVADTFVADTFVADTAKADTFVADTFVADTYVADTYVADTFVADTFVADTFVADTFVADTGAPYRHTITIDGTNDFTAASEKLPTTTASFDAYVTWDASNLYIGYVGSDVAAASSTKWLFVYFDTDPGMGTGASRSEKYTSQEHQFAMGFGAEHYYAWRSDGLFPQQKSWSGSAWATAMPTVTASRSGTYVEIKIPFSTFGTTPAKLGVTTFFVNEAMGGEWTYGGLYNTSFTDGFSSSASPKIIGNYLRLDLASSAVPNSGTYKAP